MRIEEVGNVIDFGAHGDIAGFCRLVRLDLGLGQSRERSPWHGGAEVLIEQR